MTSLAAELHRVLKSGEVLRADSFPAILRATGYNVAHPIAIETIEAALTELINGGSAQREYRRGRCFYAAMPTPGKLAESSDSDSLKVDPTRHAGRRATITHPPAMSGVAGIHGDRRGSHPGEGNPAVRGVTPGDR